MNSTRFLRRRTAQPNPKPRHGEAGFTLIEMLVVITIIGLIVGLVGPRVLNYLSESKTKTAKIQIEGLSAALDLYYLDNGRYPATNEGLVALVQRPASAPGWNGPYLKTASVPVDPWGHPYLYLTPGNHAPYENDSYGSAGPEGGQGAKTMISSAAK
jgi:general secretion pathway protein G